MKRFYWMPHLIIGMFLILGISLRYGPRTTQYFGYLG